MSQYCGVNSGGNSSGLKYVFVVNGGTETDLTSGSFEGGSFTDGDFSSDNIRCKSLLQIGTVQSTGTDSGAITLDGGWGIAKNLYTSGNLASDDYISIVDIKESTDNTTGALVTAGGIGVSGALNVGSSTAVGSTVSKIGKAVVVNGKQTVTSTSIASTTNNAAFVSNGGCGIAKSLHVGTTISTKNLVGLANVVCEGGGITVSDGALGGGVYAGTYSEIGGITTTNGGIMSTSRITTSNMDWSGLLTCDTVTPWLSNSLSIVGGVSSTGSSVSAPLPSSIGGCALNTSAALTCSGLTTSGDMNVAGTLSSTGGAIISTGGLTAGLRSTISGAAFGSVGAPGSNGWIRAAVIQMPLSTFSCINSLHQRCTASSLGLTSETETAYILQKGFREVRVTNGSLYQESFQNLSSIPFETSYIEDLTKIQGNGTSSGTYSSISGCVITPSNSTFLNGVTVSGSPGVSFTAPLTSGNVIRASHSGVISGVSITNGNAVVGTNINVTGTLLNIPSTLSCPLSFTSGTASLTSDCTISNSNFLAGGSNASLMGGLTLTSSQIKPVKLLAFANTTTSNMDVNGSLRYNSVTSGLQRYDATNQMWGPLGRVVYFIATCTSYYAYHFFAAQTNSYYFETRGNYYMDNSPSTNITTANNLGTTRLVLPKNGQTYPTGSNTVYTTSGNTFFNTTTMLDGSDNTQSTLFVCKPGLYRIVVDVNCLADGYAAIAIIQSRTLTYEVAFGKENRVTTVNARVVAYGTTSTASTIRLSYCGYFAENTELVFPMTSTSVAGSGHLVSIVGYC